MDKYEAALERAREYYAKLGNKQLKEEIEEIFPELKESEDEKNWKAVLGYVKDGALRAWLEKKKEQKEQKWSPSESEMGALYKLCYISNQITDEDDTELIKLYQDLKREYFNGHSFENMFTKDTGNQWKPTEEQLDALMNMRFAVEKFGPSASLAAINSLYNDLKKL